MDDYPVGIFVKDWGRETNPPRPDCVYVPQLNAFICIGEHICLDRPIYIPGGGQSNVGVLCEVSENRQKVRLRLYIEGIEGIPDLEPPESRSYIQYPDEAVVSNLCQWVRASSIKDIGYVFWSKDIEDTLAGVSYGMDNAYTVRYRAALMFSDGEYSMPEDVPEALRLFRKNEFHSFPESGCLCFSSVMWNATLSMVVGVQKA